MHIHCAPKNIPTLSTIVATGHYRAQTAILTMNNVLQIR